jgi:hypothetical protein
MKKLIVGITAPQSIILLQGQLEYFSNNGYDVFLLAKDTVSSTNKCNTTLNPEGRAPQGFRPSGLYSCYHAKIQTT